MPTLYLTSSRFTAGNDVIQNTTDASGAAWVVTSAVDTKGGADQIFGVSGFIFIIA